MFFLEVWLEMSGQSGSVVQNQRSIGVAVSSWCGGKKIHLSDGSRGYSWVHMHYMTYDIYTICIEMNQNVLKTIILLTNLNLPVWRTWSTCFLQSFSLGCCPGSNRFGFERRSWRTKSLDNGQITGLGILKTWGAMEGWAPTSGKLWEAGKKFFKMCWVF